jgi:hypothetical protein
MSKNGVDTITASRDFKVMSYYEGITTFFNDQTIKEAWLRYHKAKTVQAVSKFNRLVHDFLNLIGVSVVKSKGDDNRMTEDRELLALAPVFELLDKIISDS